MFDIGWSEMAVIAVVALIVLGPKEIPNALRTAAHWMRAARKLAREFQSGVDQIVREAELDEARKTVEQAGRLNIGREIEKVVDPTGETRRELNTDPSRQTPASPPAVAAPVTAPADSSSGQIAAPSSSSQPQAGETPPPASGGGSDRAAAAPEPAAAGDRNS